MRASVSDGVTNGSEEIRNTGLSPPSVPPTEFAIAKRPSVTALSWSRERSPAFASAMRLTAMRFSLRRFTAAAKNVSASPEIAVAGYSLIRSRVTCACADEIHAAATRETTTLSIGRPQRAVEIVVEIVHVLEPDREPQQVY